MDLTRSDKAVASNPFADLPIRGVKVRAFARCPELPVRCGVVVQETYECSLILAHNLRECLFASLKAADGK